MKNKIKKVSCLLLIILLTLFVPYTMVLAEETKKDMTSEESEPRETVGAIEENEDDGKMTILGTENSSSDTSESEPVTTTGDNPASVDENQTMIPMIVGTAVLVAIVLTIVIVTKNKKSEKKEGE